MPEKPKTVKEQVDQLWEVMHNHVLTRLDVLGMKLTFLLGFMALVLVILGVLATLIVIL